VITLASFGATMGGQSPIWMCVLFAGAWAVAIFGTCEAQIVRQLSLKIRVGVILISAVLTAGCLTTIGISLTGHPPEKAKPDTDQNPAAHFWGTGDAPPATGPKAPMPSPVALPSPVPPPLDVKPAPLPTPVPSHPVVQAPITSVDPLAHWRRVAINPVTITTIPMKINVDGSQTQPDRIAAIIKKQLINIYTISESNAAIIVSVSVINNSRPLTNDINPATGKTNWQSDLQLNIDVNWYDGANLAHSTLRSVERGQDEDQSNQAAEAEIGRAATNWIKSGFK